MNTHQCEFFSRPIYLKKMLTSYSFLRKACIVSMTYALMILLFYSLGNEQPFRNATVPTLLFLVYLVSPVGQEGLVGAEVGCFT
mgnify:CR=1 FL=1